MKVEKNDPLPETYFDYPYYYHYNKAGTRLEKYKYERFLFGDDDTLNERIEKVICIYLYSNSLGITGDTMKIVPVFQE